MITLSAAIWWRECTPFQNLKAAALCEQGAHRTGLNTNCHNRGADPRARWIGAGLPADIQRAQSGQATGSGAKRREQVLDEVSAAILGDAVAENAELTGERYERPRE